MREHAVALGAAFVGVIFAGGPRLLSTRPGARVLRDVPASVRRVGVFADQTIDEIADTARALGLDVVQLHGAHRTGANRRPACVSSQERFGRWFACPVATCLPAIERSAAGGGRRAPRRVRSRCAWRHGSRAALGRCSAARPARPSRRRRRPRIVLAGGLRPENVAERDCRSDA